MIPTILSVLGMALPVITQLANAGMSVYELYNNVGNIIRDAEANGGKVDAAAYAALVEQCHQAEDALDARAKEAAKGV